MSIWVVDTQVYTYLKIHQAVYLRLLHLHDWMFNLKKFSESGKDRSSDTIYIQMKNNFY